MKSRKIKIVLLSVLLIGISLAADDIGFDVKPSATKIGINDRLTLDVIIEGDKNLSGLRSPELPSAVNKDWRIDGKNSSTSTSISLVNGNMQSTKTITYHFYLTPKKKGKLAIPPVIMNHKGKQYKSRAFEIDVVDASVTSSNRRTYSNSRSQRQSNQDQDFDISDAIFLSANANKKSVYVGEPVIVTYMLYNRAQLLQLGLSKDASYPGFWAEDLYNADKIDWKGTTIRGKRYNSMLIRRSIIYPSSSGKKTTEPMALDCVVQGRSRDFFDFFGSRKKVTIDSKPITIDVKALPEAGKPADFSGAVGDLSISMSSDKSTAKANDAIQIFIKVKGTGNLKSMDDIKPKLPEAFEIYESSTSEKLISPTTGRSEKTYQYVVIPRVKGKFTIPPVSLSYFDTDMEKYMRITTESVELNIQEGQGEYTGGTIITKDDVITVGKDIAFIKTRKPESKNDFASDQLEKPSAIFYAYLLPIELLIIGLAVFLRKRKLKLMYDTGYARFVGAESIAISRIKKAKKENFISEVAEALERYISDKLNIVFGEYPPEKIYDMLANKGVEDDTLDKLKQFRSELDVARFAPGASSLNAEQAQKTAIDIIKKLEKAKKTKRRAK
ncbi:MAG: BatD family protein [Candidatus Zixiibacteriota bacterium]